MDRNIIHMFDSAGQLQLFGELGCLFVSRAHNILDNLGASFEDAVSSYLADA